MEFKDACLEFHQELINHALRLTGRDWQRSQDIVQDAMVRAIRFWDSFDPGEDARSSVRAWLFKIVTNVFMNDYAHMKMKHRVTKNYAEEVMSGSYGNARMEIAGEESGQHGGRACLVSYQPVEAAIESGVSDEIQHALNALPEDFRTAIRLYEIEGMSNKEIAEVMQTPVGTVNSRLSSGRKMLEPLLRDYAQKQWGLVVDAGQDSALVEPTEAPQTETYGVQTVVRNDDVRALDVAESTPNAIAAWGRKRVARRLLRALADPLSGSGADDRAAGVTSQRHANANQR
jgi:RNA polymerase sigma-70 factor (ECF subfamily)